MVKTVVFDYYGVIFEQGHNFQEILFPLLKKHKSHRYCRVIYQQYATGKISRATFWQRMGVSDFKTVEKRFIQAHRLDKDFLMVVRGLRRRGITLLGLSNIPKEWSVQVKSRFRLDQKLRADVLSWQTGSRKPFLYNYRLLLKRFKLQAADTLFIDDKIENIRSAKRVGYMTCWYDRYRERLQPRSADIIITRLRELMYNL